MGYKYNIIDRQRRRCNHTSPENYHLENKKSVFLRLILRLRRNVVTPRVLRRGSTVDYDYKVLVWKLNDLRLSFFIYKI